MQLISVNIWPFHKFKNTSTHYYNTCSISMPATSRDSWTH